jgi:hypothetical protein
MAVCIVQVDQQVSCWLPKAINWRKHLANPRFSAGSCWPKCIQRLQETVVQAHTSPPQYCCPNHTPDLACSLHVPLTVHYSKFVGIHPHVLAHLQSMHRGAQQAGRLLRGWLLPLAALLAALAALPRAPLRQAAHIVPLARLVPLPLGRLGAAALLTTQLAAACRFAILGRPRRCRAAVGAACCLRPAAVGACRLLPAALGPCCLLLAWGAAILQGHRATTAQVSTLLPGSWLSLAMHVRQSIAAAGCLQP